MKWASAISEQPGTEAAVDEVASAIDKALDGAAPDLLLVFVSPHHQGRYPEIPSLLEARLPGARLLGCSASGVIGDGHEVEERPAFSLTAASLPGVALTPFHLEGGAAAPFPTDELDPEAPPHFLILADPFSSDPGALTAALDAAYPRGRKVGGLASGGRFRGANALFLDGVTHTEGVVGVAMTGNIEVDTIVAQGCRPIGRPMTITRADGNYILELDRRKPSEVLHELFESLSNRDRTLFRQSLFVGLEMNESQVEYRPGELLVRNLQGMDPQSGAIAIAARLQPWQVVQFLLRDARTAAEDLTTLLERYRGSSGDRPPVAGALLFSCLGRGRHLYGRADHDTGLFHDRLGQVPLGGFFCNGEIGPVGGNTFVHGYTSAFGLFRERRS